MWFLLKSSAVILTQQVMPDEGCDRMSDNKGKGIFSSIFRKKSSSKSRSSDKHEAAGASRPRASDDYGEPDASGYYTAIPKGKAIGSPPPVTSRTLESGWVQRHTPRMQTRGGIRETFEVPRDVPSHTPEDPEDDEDPEEESEEEAPQFAPLSDDEEEEEEEQDEPIDGFLPVSPDESIPMDIEADKAACGAPRASRKASPRPSRRKVTGHEDRTSAAPGFRRDTRDWTTQNRAFDDRNVHTVEEEVRSRRSMYQPPQPTPPSFYQPPPPQTQLPPPSYYPPIPHHYPQYPIPPSPYYPNPYSPVHPGYTGSSPPGAYYALQPPPTYNPYTPSPPAYPHTAMHQPFYPEPHRHSIGGSSSGINERAMEEDISRRMRLEYMRMLKETEELKDENMKLKMEKERSRDRRHRRQED